MEIQVNTGIFGERENLVLYVNVQRQYQERTNKVTSAIYETDTEGKPNRETQIFHSSGTGNDQLEITFTFIDFLLTINDLPALDLEVVDWLFECQISEIGGTAHLRYKIRNKIAHIQNFGESELRILPAHEDRSPHLVSIPNS
jgi:hypothetical protein